MSKKLTPKQEARKAELEKKRLEKERKKEEERLEKEKKKEEERLEKERKKEEERKEKEAKKEEERKEREAKKEEERKEKEAKKEEERREKEAKKEEERKEKEAKLKKKQEEKEKKEEERKQKEEERKQKEEEKRIKEEEKRKLEELEKAKKAKVAQTFTKFFIKKDPAVQETAPEEKTSANNLNLFRVKKDMRIAPLVRVDMTEEGKSDLEQSLKFESGKKSDWLTIIKTEKRNSPRTWPPEELKKDDGDDIEILDEDEEDDEVADDIGGNVIDDEDEIMKLKPKKTKAKLLQFTENQRPAFYGTFSKKSKFVGPRTPFGKDIAFFDYDYDSDDDWEEEEPGESLMSDEEQPDREEDEEDEEDDDGFFVGHGVLDKDEITAHDDDEEGGEDGEDDFDEDLEVKKQKIKEQQFLAEYNNKKLHKLKPRVFGCFWTKDEEESKMELAYEQLLKVLSPNKPGSLVSSRRGPIPTALSTPTVVPSGSTSASKKAETPGNSKDNPHETPKSAHKKVFPEEAMKDLIRLVHANINNKMFLAKEFAQFWAAKTRKTDGVGTEGQKPESAETPTTTAGSATASASGSGGELLSKNKTLGKIAEIAEYKRLEGEEGGSIKNRKCWIVKQEVLDKYEVKNPAIPNDWVYLLEQPNKVVEAKATPPPPANTGSPSLSSTEGGGATSASTTPSKPAKDLKRESIKNRFFKPKPKQPDEASNAAKEQDKKEEARDDKKEKDNAGGE